MAFDALNKLKAAKEAVEDLGTQKTVQLLSDLNLVLSLLPDAGYEVDEMEVELGLTPKVTLSLKVGRGNEARLRSIQEKVDNSVLSAIVSSLIEAGKLQDAVRVDTLEMKDVTVVLTAAPTVSLQWKQKAPAKSQAA